MKDLYRSPPPYALAEKAARSLGLFNLQDVKWFEPSFFDAHQATQVLEEILLYYYPCFAKQYVLQKEDMKYAEYLTICRQLFRFHGIQLERKEKCVRLGNAQFQIVPKYRIKLECITNTLEVSLSA